MTWQDSLGWQIADACQELRVLWLEYGACRDKDLTEDGRALKRRVRAAFDECLLAALKRAQKEAQ